ncbi:MAG TPA: carboxypeptidase regulatory-like domain-containing protein [Terriglobales bacterium]|nr:carboxypeptidase regulatory-like domain-containing protein [Terriglobales bacterium]
MRSQMRLFRFTLPAILLASLSHAATITGTVKGPDGAPVRAVFVQAQNAATKITYMVLSDDQGRYRADKLPEGEYQIKIKATGYKADPRNAVKLGDAQTASFDFALQKAPVRWNEISIAQADKLLPADPGKERLFAECFTCHAFQTRMASVTRDEDTWHSYIQMMRQRMHFSLEGRFTDEDENKVAAYLANVFGPDSKLPRAASEMPGYKDTVRPVGSDGLNIVYVEYDMPTKPRMPFSASPSKDGSLWIPDFGTANMISRLDPKTGKVEDYRIPEQGTGAIHSAFMAPDGSVWLTEQGPNKLGKWDPATKKITEYLDPSLPADMGRDTQGSGSKHTVRFDEEGNAWSSGSPLTVFDVKTKEYTPFREVIRAYDVIPDQKGSVWFTAHFMNRIGRADIKARKVTMWEPPTKKSFPRRMAVGKDGIVWFGQFDAGQIGRFDPKTTTFKEYKLPGPQPTPYGFNLDADGYIWYSSYNQDVIGRFDPRTGKVVEYPFPHSENSIRELLPDSEGRMWYGSPSNDKVGYFYLADKPSQTSAMK